MCHSCHEVQVRSTSIIAVCGVRRVRSTVAVSSYRIGSHQVVNEDVSTSGYQIPHFEYGSSPGMSQSHRASHFKWNTKKCYNGLRVDPQPQIHATATTPKMHALYTGSLCTATWSRPWTGKEPDVVLWVWYDLEQGRRVGMLKCEAFYCLHAHKDFALEAIVSVQATSHSVTVARLPIG